MEILYNIKMHLGLTVKVLILIVLMCLPVDSIYSQDSSSSGNRRGSRFEDPETSEITDENFDEYVESSSDPKESRQRISEKAGDEELDPEENMEDVLDQAEDFNQNVIDENIEYDPVQESGVSGDLEAMSQEDQQKAPEITDTDSALETATPGLGETADIQGDSEIQLLGEPEEEVLSNNGEIEGVEEIEGEEISDFEADFNESEEIVEPQYVEPVPLQTTETIAPEPVTEPPAPLPVEEVISGEANLVEIEEPKFKEYYSDDCKCIKNQLRSYKERRGPWGYSFSIGASAFHPDQYQPTFVVSDFDTYYGSAETPMIDFNFSVRKHIALGALELTLGTGYYQNLADSVDDSQLLIFPLRLSLGIVLDTLFREPYIAPYARAGGYMMFYGEDDTAKFSRGMTSPGFFWAVGVNFQLDWLDQDGDDDSFSEHGIENTSLFVEARAFHFFSSPSTYDFSTPPQIGLGMSVEF